MSIKPFQEDFTKGIVQILSNGKYKYFTETKVGKYRFQGHYECIGKTAWNDYA